MKPKEAYQRLWSKYEIEANEVIESLVAKAEPMKVDLTTECDWFYDCPNCKGYNVMERSSYCPECGQKLDWSDEK